MPQMRPKPVFEANVITPQTIRSFMPVFSGSMIAYTKSLQRRRTKHAVQRCTPAQFG